MAQAEHAMRHDLAPGARIARAPATATRGTASFLFGPHEPRKPNGNRKRKRMTAYPKVSSQDLAAVEAKALGST